MTFLICSDLHGDLKAATEIIKIFHLEKADKLIILGDLLFRGYRIFTPSEYDPQGVAHLLNAIAEDIVAVAGNCDRLEDLVKLNFEMPRHRHFRFLNHVVFLTHGDESLDFPLAAGDIHFSGHTHLPMLKEEKGIIYANPGSASLPRGGSVASYLLMTGVGLQLKDMKRKIILTLAFKE